MIHRRIKIGSTVKSRYGIDHPLFGKVIAHAHDNAWVVKWEDGRTRTRIIWGLELVINGIDLMLEVLDDA